ncbi:MAG TPA: hypothetical protein VGQ83_06985 [Polyangia bacterium]
MRLCSLVLHSLVLTLALALAGCGSDGATARGDGGCYGADAAAMCNGTEGPQAACVALPDHTVIADPAQKASVTSPAYQQEVRRFYGAADGLPSKGVRALVATSEPLLWAGTMGGLASIDPTADAPTFAAAAGEAGTRPVTALAPDPEDATGHDLLVGFADGVGHLHSGVLEDVVAITSGDVTAVALDDTTTYVGSASGLWVIQGGVAGLETTITTPVRAVLVEGAGTVLVATATGLLRGHHGAFAPVTGLPSDDVRALARDGATVLAGTAAGLATIAGGAVTGTVRGGPGALPFEDVTALDVPDDQVIGFARGAAGAPWESGALPWHLYLGPRWLPTDHVNAVATTRQRRYFATDEGLAEIRRIPMTLAAKAAGYETVAESRHLRMDGFVTTDSVLVDANDPAAGVLPRGDEDNDGLWTQMHIAAECFGYAATGDEALYQHARRSLTNMFLEMDVPAAGNPAIDGFVARSLIRDDEPDLWAQKVANESSRWKGPVTYQGRQYLWKNDTSSDEIDGHFFGYGIYYDLCAKDEAERAEIRSHVARLADYIVASCFYLLDEDGEPTSWGKWGPTYVNEDMLAQFGARGLNAAQILSHLRVAYHVTGDARYQQAYEYLIEVHGYAENVRLAHDYMKKVSINHSDDELLNLAYYPLLRYEPDPARRAIWAEAAALSYDSDRWGLRGDRNPLWAFIYAYALGAGSGVETALADAARTLREFPLDLRQHLVDNTGRMDFTVHGDLDRFDDKQFTETPPYDEKGVAIFNSNPYCVVQGGNSQVEVTPSHWLLAYYFGLYHGFLQE